MASTYADTSFKDWLPSYGDLPMEIVLQIFQFLDHPDLEAAAATCTHWREALFYQVLGHKTVLRFATVTLNDRQPPATTFLKCDRPFRRVHLDDVTFGEVNQLMEHLGRSTHDICFENVELSDRQFYAILRQLPQLQTLSVVRCSPLFMSGSFLDDRRVEDGASFPRIRKLSLSDNQYLSDAILLRLNTLVQDLQCLDMSRCQINYHYAIQRRFYPDEASLTPSESILTFKFIVHVLRQHLRTLRELNFSGTLITSRSLLELLDTDSEEQLQLRCLRLGYCRQLNAVGINRFLRAQPSLMVLDLSDTMCVNDDCLDLLVATNPRLEELSLCGCQGITDYGAASLSGLERLRSLDLSRCSNITSEGINQGVVRLVNEVLRELRMSYVKVDEVCVMNIGTNLPQLRVLMLDYCFNGVTDESVQCLLEHLRWLRVLSLEECFRITDTALTGINISTGEERPPTYGSLDSFHPPLAASLSERENANSAQPWVKISLRSKAEEEIVRDAMRKKAMFAAHEFQLSDDQQIEGFNIQRLGGLRELNISGCNKITDVSLKFGLRLRELRALKISKCQQISFVGMEALVTHCPSIEELDLSECYNITDASVSAATSRLKRLRVLLLNGCAQLTDHSVDAIILNCQRLQTLSVYRCRGMYTDIEERLSVLPTLRSLLMDNVRPMDNAEVFRLKKRMDY